MQDTKGKKHRSSFNINIYIPYIILVCLISHESESAGAGKFPMVKSTGRLMGHTGIGGYWTDSCVYDWWDRFISGRNYLFY